MKIENSSDIFNAPGFTFFAEQPPTALDNDATEEQMKDYEEKLQSYNENLNKFLSEVGIKDVKDNVALKMTLGSIIFDLMNQAFTLEVLPKPESPKLIKRLEKEFTDFAVIADNEGEIEFPDQWLKTLDKIISDDDLYKKIAYHAEVIHNKEEGIKKTIPLRAMVLNFLPKLRDKLLEILPE